MTKETVLEVIKDVMSNKVEIFVTDADLTKNFFDLGLNSLLFVKLLIHLELELGVEFEEDLININALKNLEQLADYIIVQAQ